MFYENVLKLCELKGISLTSLLHDELRMSTGNITRWKKGTVPNGETISKLATYFNVSADYLLVGNEQKNKPAAESDELGPKGQAIWNRLKKIRAIDEDAYEMAVAQLDVILNHQEKKHKP